MIQRATLMPRLRAAARMLVYVSKRGLQPFVSIYRRAALWFVAIPELDYCVQSQGSRASILWTG